ncbi:MAG: helix-turn-helix domain-containing protein [Candidatus Nanoarchaeia archaeon]|nr:helix-turn-helix domain-containing protein [Candidatus Nanoarchaeia archaeon]
MNTQILEEIGLTKTEIKIYLTLLKLGQTTTTQIVRKAEIHASKVYEFLDKLIQKGLVSYVIKSNKKYFTASDPSFLKEFLREKQNKIKEQENEIQKILPELKNIKKLGEDTIHSEIYEGLRGIKSVYEKILLTLQKDETQYIIGAPRIGNELIEGFLLDWHKKRIKKGIKCKYIYDSNVQDYGKVREEMLFTEVRYLPKNIISPMWIEIFKDYVVIGHIKERNAVLFLIHDKEIAKGYLDYFNLIWKVSKK